MLPFHTTHLEAGLDEAGRGCLAGPVVAAAVILPEGFSNPLLNDSKQMSEKNRNILREIIENEALAWNVQFLSPLEIDELNILRASITGMQRAAMQLNPKPLHLLVDGNRFYKLENFNHTCMIKGDARFMNIAAASVLAKTHRDEHMRLLHEQFPVYGWNKNMGYPTKAHREAIRLHGSCEHHRMTFALLPKQLKMDGFD
jgi:ribonuclease HII